jgi:hypothetical protein
MEKGRADIFPWPASSNFDSRYSAAVPLPVLKVLFAPNGSYGRGAELIAFDRERKQAAKGFFKGPFSRPKRVAQPVL